MDDLLNIVLGVYNDDKCTVVLKSEHDRSLSYWYNPQGLQS